MGLAQRSLALGCMAIILVLQMTMAEYPNWMLNGKAQVFADLSAQEIQAVHDFLMSRPELELQPTRMQVLGKNSVFLIEMLLPKKKDVLEFLDKGTKVPVREAHVVIFFSAQEHPNVTEFAVGPLPQPMYMRELSPRPAKHRSWASRPMTKAERSLLYHKIKEATTPLQKFFLDTTGFSLEDCNGHCLTFTHVAPHSVESRHRATWFLLQRIVKDRLLQPTGLEILVNHGSTDVQDWSIEQVWYNDKLYNSPEELAQKYADGEVDTVVLKDPLPENTEQSQIFNKPAGEIPLPPSKTGHHVEQVSVPSYRLEGNTVIYKGWSFSFQLRPSSGLQILNAHFKNEPLAYEISVQAAMAVHRENTPAGELTKTMDLGWSMGSVTHELAPGVNCPETATFLDAVHYYDTDGPVHYPQALCIFEIPTGVPVRPIFNTDFPGKVNFFSDVTGHKLVLRATSALYNFDYIWDFIFYTNGMISAKMHATGYTYTTIYTPEGLGETRLITHQLGNSHTHLVHYRVDLDVAGTNNSFHTLHTRQKNTTNPGSLRPHLVQDTMEKTQYSQERQATFPFGQTLPPFLLFSSPQTDIWGHRRSYRLQIYSTSKQKLTPASQEDLAFSWARYSLAVTKYWESERCSTSIYNQNHPWDPPVVFEEFLQNDESIEDQDLVAWVTVGFSHGPHSEIVPSVASARNFVGFLLRPFNFFYIT
ncbi:amiloride-sensitive amine oxidase [copper-containing] [Cricetulus griseus]|uniref:Amine oxidase n=1 Tax=Cricetulus griseus TaxID=10029 RepID=G3HB74_CRIGR|nr:amiloride-sensitive amine oxidase [copper-containing] [Cricetulus griseus]XP_027284262.1 amiloride-sensitive amine oxidase [copper-containing] [Cricetulus griseus]EGV91792.1 Amiloride-sensitive amine oxidase [copper-containing] [Cricetulus griseus]ERE66881.1 amiloride-sensitive amine oxidase [copper-containing]-like protein [Cricetulus griseus]